MSTSKRKDVTITPKTGQLRTNSPSEVVEEELKRHLLGIANSIAKWSKAIERKIENKSKHNDQHPQDQAAVEETVNSLGDNKP